MNAILDHFGQPLALTQNCEIAGNRKTALRVIKNLENDIVSKCLCGLNVSPKDLYEAIMNLKGDF